jgi:DNA-binding transcriptional MerR regulator
MTLETYTANGLARVLAEEHELGTRAEIFRIIRHYTAHGLLVTKGAVHIGKGRRRSYSPQALVRAALLLRLNRLGITVGVLKELMAALDRHLRKEHSTPDLLEACNGLAPNGAVAWLEIPNRKSVPRVRILPGGRQPTLSADWIVINLGGYTPA